MKPLLFSWVKERACLAVLVLTIAGCATRPADVPRPAATPAPKLEKHQLELGGGVSVSYQIERKISTINGVSCFAFVSGTLNNDSHQILGRRTVIDFNFFSDGKQSFRDLTSPVADIPQGSRAMFEMVVSPVHKDGCVSYDRIDVSLRKVVLNRID
ncbi:hypothetical protein [Rhodoferax sp.]|jgi:hypothetical protein|uniref:hypothetical protein n=1 Tax=Rhodoferax sp. TaxID=50421 RepID=UPI00271BE06C|nr:hypothetical protein [Rhodoferax sp.]MDO9144420.1 hypothetical protein [Rhodoferax sp.]MDP1530808.1 hypothetical protein [Rhodoferax sp.]MDP1945170.1 hypothetical protein [Rhodoferax sp.]MDP2442899.1 hypothetical protein [Rhodoferax sp.]MDP3863748.1 hypothetical protein [Rhodoferax sp.]